MWKTIFEKRNNTLFCFKFSFFPPGRQRGNLIGRNSAGTDLRDTISVIFFWMCYGMLGPLNDRSQSPFMTYFEPLAL